MTSVTLARHALAFPHPSARAHILAQVAEPLVVPAVQSWLDNGWPLVVARQFANSECVVDLGIALPPALGKRRLKFRVSRDCIETLRAPCRLADVTRAAPPEWYCALVELNRRADREGLALHAFGSFAWQAITGWPYVTPASDLDLACAVARPGEPEACERILSEWEARHGRRADLEIVFPSGRAVSWREWRDVCAPTSSTAKVLAKSLRDVTLVPATVLEAEIAGHPNIQRSVA